MKLEYYGYADISGLINFRFTPAVGVECHKNHGDVQILRIPRIYNKKLNNFYFKSPKKIKDYKLVKVSIELLNQRKDYNEENNIII